MARRDLPEKSAAGWPIVCVQELRDLWVAGPGPVLGVAFSALISVIAYLTATNQQLNFLEQRESVSLTVQVAVAVGALLVLLAATDAVSGDRERGTLETILLSPLPRSSLTFGKLIAALSLWAAAFAIAVPYVWFLGRGVSVVGTALACGVLVGTLLAIFLGSFGLVVGVFARSNRIALAISLFALIAVFAPTLLPAPARKGWAGELLDRINPLAAGEHYIGRLVIDGHGWSDDLSWLLSPTLGAVLGVAAVAWASGVVRLQGGIAP